jgi:hypothetical protein
VHLLIEPGLAGPDASGRCAVQCAPDGRCALLGGGVAGPAGHLDREEAVQITAEVANQVERGSSLQETGMR